MNKNRRYCGIERVSCGAYIAPDVSFVESSDEVGCTLGDKIVQAALYGADLGPSVSVSYDESVNDDSDTHEVDMLSSPNMDFFDIAEQSGHLVESMAPAPDSETE